MTDPLSRFSSSMLCQSQVTPEESAMTVTITTIEEAEELMSDCVICSKAKFVLKTDYGARAATYSLERCGDGACVVHCHGHPEHTINIDLNDLGNIS